MTEKVYEMTYEGIKKLQDELENRKTDGRRGHRRPAEGSACPGRSLGKLRI